MRHLNAWSLLAVVGLFLAACGGTDGQQQPTCGAHLTRSSAMPTEGIPIESDVDLTGVTVALVEPFVGAAVDLVRPAATASSAFVLIVPFHPESVRGGGSLVLQAEGEGLSCTWPIEVLPLPDADDQGTRGAYAQSVDAAQARLDASLGELGVDPDVLREPIHMVPAELLPFAVAQFLIDHPDNPQDLRDVLRAGEIELDGETYVLDIDLLDDLASVASDQLSASLAHDVANSLRVGPSSSGAACTNSFMVLHSVPINTVETLRACLDAQRTAILAEEAYSVVGQLVSILSTLTWLAPEKAITTALNATLLTPTVIYVVAQAAKQDAMRLLLPDSFHVDFQVTATQLEVGEQGAWTDVSLVPLGSDPFSIDKYVVKVISAAVGFMHPNVQKLINPVMQMIATEIAAKVAEAINRTEVNAYSWDPIAIPDDQVSTWLIPDSDNARVVSLDPGAGSYRGVSEGTASLRFYPGPPLQQAASYQASSVSIGIEVVDDEEEDGSNDDDEGGSDDDDSEPEPNPTDPLEPIEPDPDNVVVDALYTATVDLEPGLLTYSRHVRLFVPQPPGVSDPFPLRGEGTSSFFVISFTGRSFCTSDFRLSNPTVRAILDRPSPEASIDLSLTGDPDIIHDWSCRGDDGVFEGSHNFTSAFWPGAITILNWDSFDPSTGQFYTELTGTSSTGFDETWKLDVTMQMPVASPAP